MQLNTKKKFRKYSHFLVAGILFNFCFKDCSAHLYICGENCVSQYYFTEGRNTITSPVLLLTHLTL